MLSRQTLSKTEMHKQGKQIKQKGTKVNLSLCGEVELGFENVEVLRIGSKQIQDFYLVLGSAEQVTGFYLKLSTANEDWSRLKQFEDIISLEIIDEEQTTYDVMWSPLSSDDQENVSQYYCDDQGSLYLWMQIPEQYCWTDILPAALQEIHVSEMACELAAHIDQYDEDTLKSYLVKLIQTMRQYLTSTVKSESDRLWVRLNMDSDIMNHWDPIIYDDTNQEDYGGIELLPYTELLGMTVQVDSSGDFWSGMAWLFWELSFNGIDESERMGARDELSAAVQEVNAFEQAIEQMQYFIDDYVQRHLNEATLPDFVAKYWPLTSGRQSNEMIELGWFDSQITEQDPDLLAEFMAIYGDQYNTFVQLNNKEE